MSTERDEIRPAATEDTAQLAVLCEQLGYPTSSDELQRRLERVLSHADHAVFVAEGAGGQVTGWVHVHLQPSLLAGRRAEIGGLVVDAGHRGQGLGRRLMAQAEAWARAHACGAVHLRSNVDRQEAHRFYPAVGYQRTKTQAAFRKVL